MRTETRTVTIGEHLGRVDWSFDFDLGDPLEPWRADALARLRTLVGADEFGELDRWEATCDSGWPKVGWGRVLVVGMYDGWPYWRPVPSLLVASPLGCAWHSWSMVSGIREVSR